MVFATTLKSGARVAVKVVHVPKHWQQQLKPLEKEVVPFTMSARRQWQHVSWATRAFVNENLHSQLTQIMSHPRSDGSPSASSAGSFWRDLYDDLGNKDKKKWNHCLVIEMPMADMTLRNQLQLWGQKWEDPLVPAVCLHNYAAAWFDHLVAGLRELHTANIMHRDLKPENCLLFYSERSQLPVLRISDLGCSTIFKLSEPAPHTPNMCTLWYRAVELFLKVGYDNRMDIWSAGCIFYELVVGQAPFVSSLQIRDDASMLAAIAKCFVAKTKKKG